MRLDNRRTPRRISLGLARVLLVAGAAGGLASCSVLYDLGADQCNADTDCPLLGEAFESYVCEEHVCVPPGGCETNADCMGEYGESIGLIRDDPAICRQRQCIPLRSDECPQVLPIGDGSRAAELLRSSETPVILGGFAELTTGSGIITGVRNYDFALTELADAVGGLPGAAGGVRPVVMVVCQGDTDDNAVLDAAMDHLADTLRVPAVVSSLVGANLPHVFNYKGLSAGMFFMSTQEADVSLERLQDQNLLWHMLPGGKSLGASYAPLLTRTLAYLSPSEPARVALAYTPTIPLLTDLALAATDTPANGGITFNEVGVIENTDAGLFQQITMPASDEQIDALLAFRPHVILVAAASDFLNNVLPDIENGWPTGAGAPARPFYVLSPYNYNSGPLRTALENFPDIRTRALGLNAASAVDRTLYGIYRGDFLTYDSGSWQEGWENYYDAVYYTLYAGARVSATGQDFAQGMSQLLSGRDTIPVGKRGLRDGGLGLVSGNQRITLEGTLGPPDFDALTGTRKGPGSAWCIEPGDPPVYISDVLRYDTADNTMQGTMPPTCIPGGF